MVLMARKFGNRFVLFICVVMVTWFFLFHGVREEKLTLTGLLDFTHQNEIIRPKPFIAVPHRKRNEYSVRSIVVMVLSKASNILQREVIRKTWGNPRSQMEYNFSVYFLLGREDSVNVKDDNGDIVQVDVIENYLNLTDKTVAAFNWVVQFCHRASYFFKVDDDVFLELDIFNEIQNNADYLPDDVILGSCSQMSLPCRKSGKWQVSYEEYPFVRYPPFCNGPGYVMTYKTTRRIHEEMKKTRIFKFEDVYVGMVAYRLGLSVKNMKKFVYNSNVYIYDWLLSDLFSRCHTITHYATPDIVQKLWEQRETIGRNKTDCSPWGIAFFLLSYIV
ncbi:UDP-GalNAc:beta-1,3-N-acetylgalactosaminyltransferase 1-like [Pecten maximus]|uniref:UDP-GalNAc:beta-1, 3-N-acetylgalactosaminyltransferase 1-like n=1 Tax=Pecten maximus TaxID=6579 RepID=UPI001458FC52|nr:UDP-GalNAc:beta-1,3-N-acetylgalactosaminyltransferase 1-like [Pecten maximus]